MNVVDFVELDSPSQSELWRFVRGEIDPSLSPEARGGLDRWVLALAEQVEALTMLEQYLCTVDGEREREAVGRAARALQAAVAGPLNVVEIPRPQVAKGYAEVLGIRRLRRCECGALAWRDLPCESCGDSPSAA